MRLRDLLPDDVALSESLGTKPRPPLLDEEWAIVAGAAPKRQAEFAAGRGCARKTLHELGIAGWLLLMGEDRQPRWPPGVVGSITHTDGFVAAASARRNPDRGFGIDAELRRPLPSGVDGSVCRTEELEWCAAQTSDVPWPTVVFSAKESIFKAWYPCTGRWIGYLDAGIKLEPTTAHVGSFRVVSLSRRRGEPAPESFRGRYKVDGTLVLTTAFLERGQGEDADV